MDYKTHNGGDDMDKCPACESTRFQSVECPETKKYFDVCLECGDGGSHLCGHADCPTNLDPEGVA